VRWQWIAIALVALGALAVAVIVAGAPPSFRTDGPLTTLSEDSVEFSVADANQTWTWGMVLPANPTISDIVLDSITPVGVSGLDILGVSISHPSIDGSIVNAKDYPPPGVAIGTPSGTVMTPVGTPDAALQALFGVRLQPGSATGAISGIRVRYRASGTGYEVTLPWSLKIDGPEASPS
jgi:hypothetical protein